MAITTTGASLSEVGSRYDVAVGYSVDGVTATMLGYVFSDGKSMEESTDITDEEHLVQISSPNSSDRFGRYPTISQGDWSGGERQLYFNNANQYYSTDGQIDVTTPGRLSLLPAPLTLTIPAGFTLLDNAPLATDGTATYLGGSTDGGTTASVWAIGGSASNITGATGYVHDLDAFNGEFYAATGNGIWKFAAGVTAIQQVTSDVTPTTAAQTLAYFGGNLYYIDSTGRKLMFANGFLGAVAGTMAETVPVFEGNINVVCETATSVFFSTSQNNESIFRTFDGATATIIGRSQGTCLRARNVGNATYILCADPGISQYLLYRLEGSTLTLLDDTRYLLADFQNRVSRGSLFFGASLWDDGRFLYVGWPGLGGLRYDTVSTTLAVSRYAGPGQTLTSQEYSSHRIVNGIEVTIVRTGGGATQLVTVQSWALLPASGTIVTSYLDATAPLVGKRWEVIEFQLAGPMPAGGSIQVSFRLDQQTAFSTPTPAIPTGGSWSVYPPAGTQGHRIQFQITLVAGGGAAPPVSFYDVRYTLGRVWKFPLRCYSNQKGYGQTAFTTTGIDLLANIENIHRLAGGDCLLFVPSPTRGDLTPPYVEYVEATLVDYTKSTVRPGPRDGNAGLDCEADVDTTFAERLASAAPVPTPPTPEEDMPIGAIVGFGGATPPTGWLLCDGSSYSTTTYPALFAVLGYEYGGSGTSFQVPDMRGRVLMMSSLTYPLGSTGGEATHTLVTGEMPVHAHGITDPGHHHHAGGNEVQYLFTTGSGTTRTDDTGASQQVTWANQNDATTGVSVQNTGGGGGHNNLQPYLAANAIIRAV